MLGAFVALLSAATFGLNNAFARRGVITGSIMQGLMITVPIGVPLMFVVDEAWFGFAFAGVIVMVGGRYCNYRSTRAVGANLTGPFLQGDMIVSLVLALNVPQRIYNTFAPSRYRTDLFRTNVAI